MTSRSRLSAGEAFSFRPGLVSVGLIGAGRVGAAVGRALSARGHAIAGVAASSTHRAERLAAQLGTSSDDAGSVAAAADLVIVAVPDDALGAVIAEIAPVLRPGTWVVHTCGRFGIEPLAPCGDTVAAVHPAAPVAPGSSLAGIAFGVTCADEAWPFAAWLTAELGGTPVRIPEERRALYHAALVIGSNFTTALAADAFALAGPELVLPLLHATVANLSRLEPGEALTGPVVRGDAGTVRAHLEAIDKNAPYLRESYVAVSKRLAAQAHAAGRLDDDGLRRIEEALR